MTVWVEGVVGDGLSVGQVYGMGGSLRAFALLGIYRTTPPLTEINLLGNNKFMMTTGLGLLPR